MSGLLQSEVFQLKEHLSSMARELAERGGREREGDRDSLGAEDEGEEGEGEGEGEEDSLRELKPGKKIQSWIKSEIDRLLPSRLELLYSLYNTSEYNYTYRAVISTITCMRMASNSTSDSECH